MSTSSPSFDTEATLGQVTQLQELMERAKGHISAQADRINQLEAEPRSIGIIAALHAATGSGPLDLSKVYWGRKILIQNGPNKGQTGMVINGLDADGDVRVLKEDGEYTYLKSASIKLASGAEASCTLLVDGAAFEIPFPADMPDLAPGCAVEVIPQSKQIVRIAATPAAGSIATVRKHLGDAIEIDMESGVQIIYAGSVAKAEKGDRLLVDASGSVALKNLGRDEDRFKFEQSTGVNWESIGGLETAKRELREAVELPHKNPAIFKFYGKKPVKGVLLYGPPGCGKTMLGKATASALAALNGGDPAGTGFIYVKGPEILDKWVGASEATIRSIFARARQHKKLHGFPAVVFIDEADAILAKRGTGISSDVDKTIVPMFLTEMDGLEDSAALVILATNRSDILDPAVVRDGRIDRKIRITRPAQVDAEQIFALNLDRVPVKKGASKADIAKLAATEVFCASRVLYEVKTKSRGTLPITLAAIVNGALVAGVVEQATSLALQRDLAKDKPEGLLPADIVAAVNAVELQNRDLNHHDEIAEFCQDFQSDVLSINRPAKAA